MWRLKQRHSLLKQSFAVGGIGGYYRLEKEGGSLTVRKPVDLKMANVYHDTANLEKALL